MTARSVGRRAPRRRRACRGPAAPAKRTQSLRGRPVSTSTSRNQFAIVTTPPGRRRSTITSRWSGARRTQASVVDEVEGPLEHGQHVGDAAGLVRHGGGDTRILGDGARLGDVGRVVVDAEDAPAIGHGIRQPRVVASPQPRSSTAGRRWRGNRRDELHHRPAGVVQPTAVPALVRLTAFRHPCEGVATGELEQSTGDVVHRPRMARRTCRSLRTARRTWTEPTLSGPSGWPRHREAGNDGQADEHGAPVELEAAGRVVAISSPDKVMFPEPGAHQARPRPLLPRRRASRSCARCGTARRCCSASRTASAGTSFFQKRIPDRRREWLQTTIVGTANGTTSRAIVMADIAHVLWAANQGCLGFHPWPYRAGDPEDTDELRIDLDPGPGVTFDDGAGGGGRGATLPRRARHRGVPQDHRQPRPARVRARRAGVGLVRHAPGGRRRRPRAMERRRPDLITGAVVEGGARRRGCSSTSTRTRRTRPCSGRGACGPAPGAQVSTPFAWDELAGDPSRRADDGRPCPPRLAARGDPWAAIDDEPQSIEPLVERYERDLAAGIPDAPWPPVYPKMPDEAPACSRAAPETGLAPCLQASVSGNTTPDVVFPDTEPGRRHAGRAGSRARRGRSGPGRPARSPRRANRRGRGARRAPPWRRWRR